MELSLIFQSSLTSYPILLIIKQLITTFVSSAVSGDLLLFFFFFDTLSLGLWIRKKEFPCLTQIGIMGPATSICSFLCCRGPGLVLCVWHIGPTNMGFEVSPAHEDSPKSRNLHFIWAWEAHIWSLFTY